MVTSSTRDWAALEQQYYQGTFRRQPITLTRGDGAYVWDSEGKQYLDLVAGLAVNVLGHCHPAIVEAVQYQVTQLIHVSNIYYNVPQIKLAELLHTLSGGMRAFFCNSGAEANEAAIKLARKYGRLHRNGAYEIISMDHGFHGRTLATTAATGKPAYHATWAPIPDGFKQVPFNDLEALKAATTDKTVGILIETIQGESGVWPADKAFLQGVRAWCDEQNLVLILDEIQSGMGRTGKFFAYEHYGITPDIITLAKGLAGGVPIGAMLTGTRTDLFTPGEHGTTFGGNPIACAAGVATLTTMLEENLLDHVANTGKIWRTHLERLCASYPFIDSPRGMGLMQAFHVKHDLSATIVQQAHAHSLLVNNPTPDAIRMIPPLTLSSADLEVAAERLDQALAAVAEAEQL